MLIIFWFKCETRALSGRGSGKPTVELCMSHAIKLDSTVIRKISVCLDLSDSHPRHLRLCIYPAESVSSAGISLSYLI